MVNATVQAFAGPSYSKLVKLLCKKYDCNYEEIVAYYKPPGKINYGIDRLKLMLYSCNENERSMKELFKTFMSWYLRSGGYMKYLLE